MKRVKAGLVILLIIGLLAGISQVLASTYLGTVDITCTGWSALGTGSHILNRDNTGAGREKLRIVARDGAGTVIYSFTYSNVLTTYTGGIGSGAWVSAPQYNPITWTLISLAGNGYTEQVDSTATGGCAGLPVYAIPCALDSRLNNDSSKDCAAPVVIYANPIRIFAVNPQGGAGRLVIELTQAEIDGVGVPSENTLLKHISNPYTGQDIAVYRLATGEFQVNTVYQDGKLYIVVWDKSGNLYHLDS